MKFHRRWLAASLPLLWAATPASALEWELSTTTEKPAALQWQMLPETTGNTADLAIKSNNSEINSSDSTSAGNYTFNETADNENTVKTNTLEIIPAIAKPYAATQLAWEPVAEADVITPEQVAAEIPEPVDRAKALANAIFINRSGPTYANYRALWRDGDWLPQISNTVPVGFGPQGVMASLIVQGTDCHLGKGRCKAFSTYDAWKDSLTTQANGEFYQAIGFGDPINFISVILTNSLERIPANINSGSLSLNENIFQGAQTGIHIAKAVGPDTSFRVGVENLITWDNNDYIYADMVRNFYAVGSQRIRLQSENSTTKWLPNLYLTAGIGNGEFKPIEKIFLDQTAALRNAGCSTYGYYPATQCSQKTFKRALRDGSDYGQLNPIGSLGIEIYNGINLITEWTGRNLNAGLSWRPIPGVGLVITPMVLSLVNNCEYPGCKVNVPDYPDKVTLPSSVLTERTRLSLQVSLEVKF